MGGLRTSNKYIPDTLIRFLTLAQKKSIRAGLQEVVTEYVW
jgi:hypothetical protein